MQTAEWDVYRQAVEHRHAVVAEGILHCADFAAYKELVGALKAYEEMFTLPEQVLVKWEELHDRAERTESADTLARADRHASTKWSRWATVDSPR